MSAAAAIITILLGLGGFLVELLLFAYGYGRLTERVTAIGVIAADLKADFKLFREGRPPR